MNWTDEQKSAIDERNGKLLVAAGAGSGKTAVLVQRILNKIIEDKIQIDQMLIVTFTNAAASEMRERIRDGLYKALEEHPELQNQILLINKASIMTIDAFCKKVISDHFFKLGLDPNYRVADMAENELLKLEALEEVLEEIYEENDEKKIEVLEAYSGSKSDEGVKGIILDIDSFIQSSPYPEAWLHEKCEMYHQTEDDFAKTIWGKEIILYARSELRGILEEEEALVDSLMENHEAKNYLLTLQEDIVILKTLLQNMNTWNDFYEYLSKLKLPSLKQAPKLDEETKNEVKDVRDKMKDLVAKYLRDEVFIASSDEIFQSMQKIYEKITVLSEIVLKFEEEFTEKKHEKGLIDFSDMEHLCLKLLSENQEIAKYYKEKYEEILVDEYQDSNLIQEYILNMISRGNLFMVGDVKQSIYRFRQARPELFLEKYHAYTADLSQGSLEKKILLFQNFRSNQNIIEQANFIFQNIMSHDVGEIDYTEDEFLKLGADYYPNQGEEAEFHFIETKMKDTLEEGLEDDIEEKPQLEGRVIASRILEIVGKMDVYDKTIGGMRKARFSDIAILLRATKSSAEVFVDELNQKNIPAFADINTGYFENAEVQVILSLLKIIDNPYQDIPLVAVLRSEIGKFSPNELSEIRAIDKASSFYEAMMKSIGNGNQKVAEFVSKLNNWRELSRRIPLDELIWTLYEETGYYHYVSLLPDGKIRTSNLKALLDRASRYDKTSYRGLFNFINFLDHIRESSGDFGSSKPLSENDNVVRIMSIHKSKGLEFPIVFLAGTSRRFNMRDFSSSMILHQDLGFGADVIDVEKRIYYPSVPKLALKLRGRREAISEEMRILYVALTRAREKLIITAMVPDAEKVVGQWSHPNHLYLTANSTSFAEWIGRTVIGKTNLFKQKVWTYQEVLALSNESNTLAKVLSLEDLMQGASKESREYQTIQEKLTWQYPYANSTKIPNKVTVTELKRLNTVLEENENKVTNEMITCPDFLKQEAEKMTGNKYGTLVHNLMQRLDMHAPNVDTILDSVEADEVTKKRLRKDVESFLQSSFYQEVKKADKIYKEAPFNLEVKVSDVYDVSDSSGDDILMIQGIIDMYYETPEGLVLVDYKTDHVENEQELITRYKKQLDYYEEALEKLTKQDITKKIIYSFALQKAIEI